METNYTIIYAKELFDGTDSPVMESPVLIIENEKIINILARDEFNPEQYPGATILDCSKSFIMPGLIDTHVHVHFGTGENHDEVVNLFLEERDNDLLPYRSAKNVGDALLNGITTIRDCGGFGYLTIALKRAIDKGIIDGPRMLVSGMPITSRQGHLYYCGCEAGTREEVKWEVENMIKQGADFIKVCGTGGMMTSGSNPLLPQYQESLLKTITSLAHNAGLPVSAHILNTEGIRRAINSNIDFIEHCFWRNSKGEPEYDPTLTEEILRKDTAITVTLAGNDRKQLRHVENDSIDESWLAELKKKYEFHKEMQKAGVKFLVGSDAGVRLTPFGEFWRTLETFHYVFDVPIQKVLHTVTGYTAQRLGISEITGTLEPGKSADFIILENNPMENLKNLTSIKKIFLKGKEFNADERRFL